MDQKGSDMAGPIYNIESFWKKHQFRVKIESNFSFKNDIFKEWIFFDSKRRFPIIFWPFPGEIEYKFLQNIHPIKEHGDSVFGNDPILVKELKETIANQRVNQPIIAVKTYNETWHVTKVTIMWRKPVLTSFYTSIELLPTRLKLVFTLLCLILCSKIIRKQ